MSKVQFSITINGQQLGSNQLILLDSEDFQTARWQKSFTAVREYSKGILHVEIYAGISEENTEHGGWYIFCNDRLILGNDQSSVTGWGDKTPKYHTQYNRFRGYVFFNSDNADLLPWNTVKNNMDVENPYFQDVRDQMIRLMRPVVDFLNWVHVERQRIDVPAERTLAIALAKAVPVALSKVENIGATFSSPRPQPVPPNRNTTVSYVRPKEDVELAKDFFGVKSNQEVGTCTFNYWYEAEISEQ